MMYKIQNFIKNSEFLSWYFNSRARISKKPFIITLTVISLMLTMLTYADKKDEITKASKNLSNFSSYQSFSGNNLSPHQALSKILSSSEDSDDLVEGLGEAFGVEGFSDKKNDSQFSWVNLIKIIVFSLTLPLVMMRLRDIGKEEGTVLKIVAIISLSVAFDFIEIIGIFVSYYIYVPAWIVSGVILTWACFADSQKYIPPSKRNPNLTEEKVARPDPIIPAKKNDDF